MGRFLNLERKRQAAWRARTSWISAEAVSDEGRYSKRGTGPYDFCLPPMCAKQNLFADVADQMIDYFRTPPGAQGGGVAIPWHDGKSGHPSTHLCDSQVCCVNFLSPFQSSADAATALLRRAFDNCVGAAPVQPDTQLFVEFEWLGDPSLDLLGEGRPRQRGANATSLDAAMCFIDSSEHRHLVLIEWKYTESYSRSEGAGPSKFAAGRSGDTRRARYGALYAGKASPVRPGMATLEDLGFEPFYQFLRQQLLAQALESAYSSVHVLHIAPRANSDFLLVTPERLRSKYPDDSATQVWRRLLVEPDAFKSMYTEDLFGPIVSSPPVGLERWAQYIKERYEFVG